MLPATIKQEILYFNLFHFIELTICKLTFALALLKNTPNENKPSVTPPIRPLSVSVACKMPPSCSTKNTSANDRIPKLE